MSITISNKLNEFVPIMIPYFQVSSNSLETLWLIDAGKRETSKYFYLTIPYRRIKRYVNLFDYVYNLKLDLDIYSKNKRILSLKFKPVERTLKTDSIVSCKDCTLFLNNIYISKDYENAFSKYKTSYANIYFNFDNSNCTYNTENNDKLYNYIFNRVASLSLNYTLSTLEFLSLSCIYRLDIE